MPFPSDTYNPQHNRLLKLFVNNYVLNITELNDPTALCPYPGVFDYDFYVTRNKRYMINNFRKEKPNLTKDLLINHMRGLDVKKLLVPLIVDNLCWAIVVFDLDSPHLTFYNLQDTFSPQQIAKAFCDLMSCEEDRFFINPENYVGVDTMFCIDHMVEDDVYMWGALKAFILDLLHADLFLNLADAEQEMERCIEEALKEEEDQVQEDESYTDSISTEPDSSEENTPQDLSQEDIPTQPLSSQENIISYSPLPSFLSQTLSVPD